MNARQRFALLHPLNGPDDVDRLDELTAYRQGGYGLLAVLLAVDR